MTTWRPSPSSLISLIINTVYSNKEIFLRELYLQLLRCSGQDQVEGLHPILPLPGITDQFPRYESLTDASKLEGQPKHFIKIIPDIDNKTLTIIDSGIGMMEVSRAI